MNWIIEHDASSPVITDVGWNQILAEGIEQFLPRLAEQSFYFGPDFHLHFWEASTWYDI